MSKKLYWNLFGVLSLGFMILLIVVAIGLTFQSFRRDILYTSLLSMSIDIVGMIICATLFSSMLYDHRMTKASVLFMILNLMVCALLFSEFMTFRYDRESDFAVLASMMNHYTYALAMIILLNHWLYLKQQIPVANEEYEKVELLYYACFFAGMGLLVVNALTGCIFHIDYRSGEYIVGDYVLLMLIPPTLMLLINAYCAHRFYTDRRSRNTLYVYSAMCFIGLIVQGLTLYYLSMCIFFLFATFLIHGGFYVERGEEITRKDAKIVEQNVTMMISQIQPYFLYNSLNSIAKMEGNPPETVKAVEDFAKYLRSNMNTISQTTTIPFEKEMEHVQTYVDLEKLRFKDKLNVVYTITDSDFRIPPLTLQMLVENAIKHGITQKEEGGTVTIVTAEEGDTHRITVTDDGVGFDTSVPPSDDTRSHVGILNITERLRDLLDGTLEISSEIGRGTVAVITIPKNTINIDSE